MRIPRKTLENNEGTKGKKESILESKTMLRAEKKIIVSMQCVEKGRKKGRRRFERLLDEARCPMSKYARQGCARVKMLVKEMDERIKDENSLRDAINENKEVCLRSSYKEKPDESILATFSKSHNFSINPLIKNDNFPENLEKSPPQPDERSKLLSLEDNSTISSCKIISKITISADIKPLFSSLSSITKTHCTLLSKPIIPIQSFTFPLDIISKDFLIPEVTSEDESEYISVELLSASYMSYSKCSKSSEDKSSEGLASSCYYCSVMVKPIVFIENIYCTEHSVEIINRNNQFWKSEGACDESPAFEDLYECLSESDEHPVPILVTSNWIMF